ncbi:DoxX family protein [Mucilaginibacter sp.]
MSPKIRNIIGWVLTAVLAFIFISSAYMKLAGGAKAIESATGLGISADAFRMLGVVEIVSLILFIIPRTGLLGTLLLAAYLGGAIATHLEHHQSIMAPVIIQCVLWITATIRFPELSRRLMGTPDSYIRQ